MLLYLRFYRTKLCLNKETAILQAEISNKILTLCIFSLCITWASQRIKKGSTKFMSKQCKHFIIFRSY